MFIAIKEKWVKLATVKKYATCLLSSKITFLFSLIRIVYSLTPAIWNWIGQDGFAEQYKNQQSSYGGLKDGLNPILIACFLIQVALRNSL